MITIATTNAEQLWCFLKYLDEKEIKVDTYLHNNLIPQDVRSNGQIRITTLQVYNFLQEVIDKEKLTRLGWEVGVRYGSSALQGLTLDAFAEESSEALFNLIASARRHATGAKFFILKDRNRFELCNIGSTAAKTNAYLHSEYYLLAVYIDMVRRTFKKPDYLPTYVRFRSRDSGFEPSELRDVATDYEQPYFSVDIPLSWYRSRGKTSRAVSQQSNPGLCGTLTELLTPHLANRIPTINEVSGITAIPVRNLQRQLEKEGTSYRALVLKLRMNEAAKLLRDTSIPVREISRLVGYHQSTHCCRAFRKKTGLTPQQYRIQRPRH